MTPSIKRHFNPVAINETYDVSRPSAGQWADFCRLCLAENAAAKSALQGGLLELGLCRSDSWYST